MTERMRKVNEAVREVLSEAIGGLLDDAVRYLHGQEFELVQAERHVVAPDD